MSCKSIYKLNQIIPKQIGGKRTFKLNFIKKLIMFACKQKITHFYYINHLKLLLQVHCLHERYYITITSHLQNLSIFPRTPLHPLNKNFLLSSNPWQCRLMIHLCKTDYLHQASSILQLHLMMVCLT